MVVLGLQRRGVLQLLDLSAKSAPLLLLDTSPLGEPALIVDDRRSELRIFVF